MFRIGDRNGRLYYLTVEAMTSEDAGAFTRLCKERIFVSRTRNPANRRPMHRTSYMMWHVRLGHANVETVCRTLKGAGIEFDFRNCEVICPVCQLVNARRRTIRRVTHSPPKEQFGYRLAEDVFQLPVESVTRMRYASFMIDVYTGFCWIMLMRRKSEAPFKVTSLIDSLEATHAIKVVQVQSDRGELYRGHFPKWAQGHRPNVIEQIRSPADLQDFNGAVERPQGIVRARAAAMLVSSHLPMSFYMYALRYACDVWNAIVHTNRDVSPYELVYGKQDDVRRLQPFGCLVFVQISKESRKTRKVPKLQKALPGIFLGYAGETIILVYFFNTRQVREEYHVRFSPSIFPGLRLKTEHLRPNLTIEQGERFDNAPVDDPRDELHEPARPSELMERDGERVSPEEFDGVLEFEESDNGNFCAHIQITIGTIC